MRRTLATLTFTDGRIAASRGTQSSRRNLVHDPPAAAGSQLHAVRLCDGSMIRCTQSEQCGGEVPFVASVPQRYIRGGDPGGRPVKERLYALSQMNEALWRPV